MNGEMVWRHFAIGDEIIDEGNIGAVIQPLWWSVSIYDGETEMLDGLERFSEPQQYVWAIQWYLSEAVNNGHEQFFSSPAGIVWRLAAEGLNAVGCAHAADILTEAAERIGGSPSFDRDQRRQQIMRHNADFDDLDDALCSSVSSVENALCNYVQSNRGAFYFDGEAEVPEAYFPDGEEMFFPGFGGLDDYLGRNYR